MAEGRENVFVVALASAPQPEHVKQFCASASALGPCHVLWFVDEDADDWCRKAGLDSPSGIQPMGARLCQGLVKFGREMRDFSRNLLRALDRPSDIWMSRLADINFADPAWFSILRASLVIDEIEQRRPEHVFVIGEGDFVAMIKTYAGNHGIAVRGRAIESAPQRGAIARAMFACATNIFRDLAWHGKPSSLDTVQENHRPWLITNFPANWRPEGDRLVNRYAGPALSLKTNNLLSLSRRFERLLRPAADAGVLIEQAQRVNNARICERSGTLSGMAKSYFRPKEAILFFRSLSRAEKSGLLNWRGMSLKPVLRRLLADALLVDIPKNRFLRHCISRALSGQAPRLAVVPAFELSEGRAFVAGAHDAGLKVIGLQHGSLGLAHIWRFSWQSVLCPPVAQPDKWVLETDCVRPWLLEAGIPEESIHVFGAIREDRVTPEFSLAKATRRVMILGEMHAPHHFLRQALNAFSDFSFEIVIRPHPATTDALRPWISKEADARGLNVVISEPSRRLEDELDRWAPRLSVIGTSGAGVSMAAAGWPVTVLFSNWLPNNNPLLFHAPDGGPIDSIFCATDPATFRDWMRATLEDEGRLAGYSDKCRIVGQRLMATSGSASAQMLDRLIEMEGLPTSH